MFLSFISSGDIFFAHLGGVNGIGLSCLRIVIISDEPCRVPTLS